MEISRRLLVIGGFVFLLILALGIALTLALKRTQRLEEELAVRVSEYERDRQESAEGTRDLRSKLESAQTKVTVLEAALEQTRSDLIRARRPIHVDATLSAQ